jgi:cholesterol transport system auxiliary component
VIVVPRAAAPAPLDGTGIVYRLAYVDPARAEIYADSRWAERMNLLITQRVKSHLAGLGAGVVNPGDGARADYVLRLELEDFSQHFDSASASRAIVRVRAALVDANSRALRAQRTFSAERPAGGNAAGGVKALGEAADAVIGELVAWTAQNVIAAGNK